MRIDEDPRRRSVVAIPGPHQRADLIDVEMPEAETGRRAEEREAEHGRGAGAAGHGGSPAGRGCSDGPSWSPLFVVL
jgi:hypothetical protein